MYLVLVSDFEVAYSYQVLFAEVLLVSTKRVPRLCCDTDIMFAVNGIAGAPSERGDSFAIQSLLLRFL